MNKEELIGKCFRVKEHFCPKLGQPQETNNIIIICSFPKKEVERYIYSPPELLEGVEFLSKNSLNFYYIDGVCTLKIFLSYLEEIK
jgi:hypothetical protein